jgi:hypothetical protein
LESGPSGTIFYQASLISLGVVLPNETCSREQEHRALPEIKNPHNLIWTMPAKGKRLRDRFACDGRAASLPIADVNCNDMIILAALVTAVFVSALFSLVFGARESSGMPVLLVFLILLFAGLAAQYWITPFGPLVWGISWLPLVTTVIVIGLLLATPSPYGKRKVRLANEVEKEGTGAVVAVSIFMWILLFVLAAIAIVGYIRVL